MGILQGKSAFCSQFYRVGRGENIFALLLCTQELPQCDIGFVLETRRCSPASASPPCLDRIWPHQHYLLDIRHFRAPHIALGACLVCCRTGTCVSTAAALHQKPLYCQSSV